jgi:iron(III) transport system ATP-binding protein
MSMYLVLDNIIKTFASRGGVGEVTAVDGVSLNIQRGELVTLLGPSGCGKTTTLRLIAGFEFPTSGRILLDGQAINDLPLHKRDMSMVFQSYAIFPHLNVFENIAYGLNVQRRPGVEIKQRVARVLELVELTGLENRAPNQLSGGQQQRVALARALIMEPKVLLMDEPLSNLDAKLREQMRTEIRRIQKRLGITSVYVTHDQVEAMTLSDQVVVMNKGKIEQIGPPTEIYRRPATRFVADFIGRANFVEATVREWRDGQLVLDALGAALTAPAPAAPFRPGEAATLVVRPEMIEIVDGDAPRTTQYALGIVRRAAYLGSVIEYDVEVSGQLLALVERDPRRAEIHPEGQAVKVRFLEDCLYVLPKNNR